VEACKRLTKAVFEKRRTPTFFVDAKSSRKKILQYTKKKGSPNQYRVQKTGPDRSRKEVEDRETKNHED